MPVLQERCEQHRWFISSGLVHVVKAENRGADSGPRRKPLSGAEAGRAQTTGESTQAESLQKGEPVKGVVGVVSLSPASWRRAPPFATGHPFLAWMNHSCSDVHQNVGPTCGPMAPLCTDIFLKRTGPKKEGLKNNSVFTLPHAPLATFISAWGQAVAPLVLPSGLPTDLLCYLSSLSLLPVPSSFAVHPGCLLLWIFILPPFHMGLLYSLTSGVLPPHLPHSSLPACPSFPCHAVRAPLLPYPMTAVPSEILLELAWCRAGRLGCWCAVRGANEWCKFYDSSLLPTVSDKFCAEDFETGSLTISAPLTCCHENLASF